MDKQTIEQAAAEYSNCDHLGEYAPIVLDRSDLVDTKMNAFISGAEFATPKWIPVSEDIPQYTKALVYATTGLVFTDSFFDGKFDRASGYCYTISHYIPLDSLPKP